MGRVANKIALVTGAASGIGRGAAERLAAEGAIVMLADRDEAGGQAAAAALGAPHAFHALDVVDEAAWGRVVADIVAAHGRIDILVNAAGIAVWRDLEQTTLAEWRHVHAVNNDGTFLGCKTVVPAMKQAGGSIINLSSVAGLIGDPGAPAYCASKGAVRMLTKSVALYFAKQKYAIRCNSIHPSFIATPMVEAVIREAPDGRIMRAMMERAAPLGRMGEVDDIAHAIVYLASDESKFVTGTELVVDGGLTAR